MAVIFASFGLSGGEWLSGELVGQGATATNTRAV
jgi:hypothetical protein